MQHLALLFLIIFSFNLYCQNDNWLKNADITYLIEAETEVSTEEVIYQNRDQPLPAWERLKMAPDCTPKGELADRLRSILVQQIEAGKLIAQTTDQGRNLTLAEVNAQFYGLDTVVVFNPATYQEMIQVVRTDHRIGALRLKINLAWNASSQKLQTKVIGFHVIGDQYAEERTFFYVSLPQLPKSPFDLHDKNWGWVGQSKPTVNWETAKVLKGSSVVDFVEEVFLEQAARKNSFPVYEYRCDEEPLSADQIAYFASSVDTVLTISPETYEETITIIRNQVEAEDISGARLELQCYIDSDVTQLFFVPQYITPMIAEKTNKGLVRFYRPFYFIRME